MAQLPAKEHRRPARIDAYPLVNMQVNNPVNMIHADLIRWCALWSLRDRPGMTVRQCNQITTNRKQNFSFALKFQPQAFAGLTLISWGQTLYYHKWVSRVCLKFNR